ncbi:unnamed protein product [Cochlearia groenlandica]
MKTSINTIFYFFVVILSISSISLAKKTNVESCIARNIAQSISLSPSPSIKPETFYSEDEYCREEARIIMYFLKLNGKFPSYYVEALCNVLGDDEKKVKEYVTKKWLNHSKKLINSLACIKTNILVVKKSHIEACIARNIAKSISPSPPNKLERSYSDVVEDEICRDEARIIMYFLRLNGKFPSYYVEALCNVFGDDEKKVKEYVMKQWLNHSKKLINSLSCDI